MKYILILFLFVHPSLQSTNHVPEEHDKTVTSLDQIKEILREKKVFDWDGKSLTTKDKSELQELGEELEVMMSSRARQPENVQRVFSPLLTIKGIVTTLHKNKVISQGLAEKFKWDRLNSRHRRNAEASYRKRYKSISSRSKPRYYRKKNSKKTKRQPSGK